jgi:hypothetical protein
MASICGIVSLPLTFLFGAGLASGGRRHCANLLDRGSADFDALITAAFAAGDFNSGNRHIQTGGQEAAESLIGAIIKRRRGQADAQGPLPLAG